jgi:hypothetical protein
MAKYPAEDDDKRTPNVITGLSMDPSPDLSIFSARRNSGKTHLITHMLSRVVACRRYGLIIVMCPTSFNQHYQKYTKNIVPNFDERVIEQVIAKQRAALEGKGKRIHVLLVLDDCVGHTQFKNPVFELLASQGRHYLISVWLSTQHIKKCPPIVRNNADYLYLLGKQTLPVLKTFYEEFGADFGDFEGFVDAVGNASKNYGCFIINNLKQTFHEFRAPAKIRGFRF